MNIDNNELTKFESNSSSSSLTSNYISNFKLRQGFKITIYLLMMLSIQKSLLAKKNNLMMIFIILLII